MNTTTMQKDIRETASFREAEALYRSLRQPGTGQVSDAGDVHASPDGRQVLFTGIILDVLKGSLPSRICQTDLATGSTDVLTFGPNEDRLPKYSPSGEHIAFLSDRHKAGDFQLYLLNPITGAVRSTPAVDGWVEYLHWSPDGRRVLLGVASHGADVAGSHGAVTSKKKDADVQSWMPAVETPDQTHQWRRSWVYDLATDVMRQVSRPNSNIWEAAWCGNESIVAVASPGPGEGLWYSAHLVLVEIESGRSRQLYAPQDQLGCPVGSPSGGYVVVVEAVCSDRWLVAGDLHLIDTASGKTVRVDALDVDISFVEWRSDHKLLLAGHRGFETVVGLLDAASAVFTQVWASSELTSGGRTPYATVAGIGDGGDCILVGESFLRAPELAVIKEGKYVPIKSFDLGYGEQTSAFEPAECVCWQAPDGLKIQGWLLRPKGNVPHALVMYVHGGPVWHWRPMWMGRYRGMPALALLKKGYAVFLPNPRGSSGRGREFARRVVGDMHGVETNDFLSGLDYLVARGVADPKRIGVMGASYGGATSSWLVTQDPRFAAAVSVAPITNYVSGHLISNIPHFYDSYLGDKFNNSGGNYFQRSSIMHAHKAKTPTLNICGMLDRCTPPEEAAQFHSALLENGTKSVLVAYPEEGHGVRKFPALIDYAARVTSWFAEHMPPGSEPNRSNQENQAMSK